jgi:hypothetical protein
MGNPATKAPNFTPELAAKYAPLATIAREKNREMRRLAAEAEKSAVVTDDARKTQTLNQIDRLDKLINAALDDDDADLFLKLTAAKERLWKLVQPTAGVNKPRQSSRPAPPTPSV